MRFQTFIGAAAALALAACANQQGATGTAPTDTTTPATTSAEPGTVSGTAAGSTTAPGAGGAMAGGGAIDGQGGRRARAVLESRSGSTVTGVAEFVEVSGNRVELTLRVSGATPGEHGAHLHMNGDCSDPKATSAGDHWNPANTPHGAPDHPEASHAGDLGNITVGQDGTGTLRITRDHWSIGPSHGKHDVLGRAVIVHASPDDLKSQPAGNAGARQACGVVSGQQ